MKFLQALTDEAKGFSDPAFVHTLFDKYEQELARLEKLYQAAAAESQTQLMQRWLSMKHTLLRQQLQATILLQAKSQPDKPEKTTKKSFDTLYQEAMKEFPQQ